MSGKIIVVCGYLAAGKSTFARRLSKELNVPYLVKDTFKSAICAGVAIESRQESSRFSAITFDAMAYVVERFMETRYPIIIEGNFVPAGLKKTDEAGVIRALTEKYDYNSLMFMFTGDTKILAKRFAEREKTPERGQANQILSEFTFEEFDKCCRNLDDFDIGGEVVRIDTTDFDEVDFEGYIETARGFINGGSNRL